MKRSELEFQLTLTIAQRQIGLGLEHCMTMAKEWAPKVMAQWPDLVERNVLAETKPVFNGKHSKKAPAEARKS